MAIHHSQVKKAEKMGVTLEEDGDGVTAFWPKRALKLYGASASDAMAQMQAAQVILSDDTFRIVVDPHQRRLVDVVREDGMVLVGGPMPPVAAHKTLIIQRSGEWANPDDSAEPDAHFDDAPSAEPDPAKSTKDASSVERINGVAVDGAIAYREGTPAGDCPYSSEEEDDYDDFVRWNDEWDNAADEASEEEGTKGGSVVSEKYRAKYAEMGHPTHCGDWLAEYLNNLVANKGGTNLELFEEICGLNGVDTSKYKRSGVGWQGRIRMTGRNLMAKRVFLNNGKLILPQTINGGSAQAPAEWMAMQRFKAAKNENK